MLLTKLRITVLAAGLVLTGIGAVGLTYRVAAQQSNPGPGGGAARQGRPRAVDLESLRREIEALRKDLRATRERVQALEGRPKIAVTRPQAKDVIITEQYVCQLLAQRHINVRALAHGFVNEVPVKEGQAVKRGDVLFRIEPTLYRAKHAAELAEVRVAEIEFNNTKKLFEQKVITSQEVALRQAKLDKALAKARLAEAELNFTTVKAPFDGIAGRVRAQVGSLINERDTLTTLSDNRVMLAYFNVPEARYLEYKAGLARDKQGPRIELVLANGSKFPRAGKISAIEADFDSQTGTIAFRADFENPDGLLRHGQTGTVLIRRTLPNAIVIPQRAAFDIANKRYVFVVDKDNVAHQREIIVQNELDDLFVIQKGLDVNDRIVLEGVRQVRDGERLQLATPK